MIQPGAVEIDSDGDVPGQPPDGKETRQLVAVVRLREQPQLQAVRRRGSHAEGRPRARTLSVAPLELNPVPVAGERNRTREAVHHFTPGLVAPLFREDGEDRA